MKIYDGLEAHQAIQLESGSYVVQLGLGYGNSYEIAGAVSRGNQQVVVEDLSEIKRYIPEQKKTIGAIIADGSEVPIETIQQFNAKYSHYEDEDGRMWFGEDTEAELQYVKDKAYYRVQEYVYETAPAYTEDLEITVVGSVEDTGSEFIETPFLYGQVSFARSGVYRVHLSRIAVDEFNNVRNEYQEVSFELPTHSHLKYAKVDTQYVFTAVTHRWIVENNYSIVLNDLEQAKQKEKEIRKFVRDTLRVYAEPRKVGDVEIKDFVKTLSEIKSSVVQLHVKQKSVHSHRALVSKITGCIEKYLEEN